MSLIDHEDFDDIMGAAAHHILALVSVLFVLLPCALDPPLAHAEVPTPEITAPVTDLAGVLDETQEARLARMLVRLRQQSGAQMAVLLVKTTGGEPIEDFSLRVAEGWGGGSQERDDGLLLTLAIDDRRSRLEVGYGLEAAVTDARALRVLDEGKDELQAANYAGALEEMVEEAGEYVLPGVFYAFDPSMDAGEIVSEAQRLERWEESAPLKIVVPERIPVRAQDPTKNPIFDALELLDDAQVARWRALGDELRAHSPDAHLALVTLDARHAGSVFEARKVADRIELAIPDATRDHKPHVATVLVWRSPRGDYQVDIQSTVHTKSLFEFLFQRSRAAEIDPDAPSAGIMALGEEIVGPLGEALAARWWERWMDEVFLWVILFVVFSPVIVPIFLLVMVRVLRVFGVHVHLPSFDVGSNVGTSYSSTSVTSSSSHSSSSTSSSSSSPSSSSSSSYSGGGGSFGGGGASSSW